MTTDSASARSTDLLAFREAMKRLFLEWAEHLSQPEITLTGWLLSNTLGRGNAKGSYAVSQMIRGIHKKDGTGMWCCGTGLGEATIHRVIASLEAKGVIWVFRETNRASNFMVNVNWSPTLEQAEDTNVVEFPGRKPPKRPSLATRLKAETDNDVSETDDQGSQNDTPGGLTVIPQGSQNDTHQRTLPSKDLQETKVSVSPSAHAAAPTARDVVSGKMATTPVAPAPKAGNVTTFTLEQAWRFAHRDAFPTVQPVAWTAKERAMLKAVMKKFDPVEFQQFLGWLVSNWTQALEAQCGWMKKGRPVSPVIGFVARHHRALWQAWVEREQDKYRGTLPDAERRIAEKMAKGLTRDAAILEVAKDAALEADRKARDRELAAAASALSTAKAIERGAEAKVQQAYAQMGRMARKVQQQAPKADLTDSKFDPDKGVELEQLPKLDLEKFAK